MKPFDSDYYDDDGNRICDSFGNSNSPTNVENRFIDIEKHYNINDDSSDDTTEDITEKKSIESKIQDYNFYEKIGFYICNPSIFCKYCFESFVTCSFRF